jgi:hypothetical protein
VSATFFDDFLARLLTMVTGGAVLGGGGGIPQNVLNLNKRKAEVVLKKPVCQKRMI